MFHGLQDFGFPVQVYQLDNLLNLVGQTQLGLGEALYIAMGGFSQGEESVPVFEIGAVRLGG